MYRYVSQIFPENAKKRVANLLRYANLKINPDRFLGFVLVFGILLSITSALFLGFIWNLSRWIIFIGSFIFFEGLVYYLLLMLSDKKAKWVELVLPDVLQLMASNLRAGYTTDKAFLLSARPEFGPFQDEINQVGKEITIGKPVENALMDLSFRIDSDRLRKTILLIVSGLKSGGELAMLLEQTSRNLRRATLIDSRIRANVMMYVIFIFVAVGLGAPMLFGLSSFLVEVFSSNLGGIDIPDSAAASLPFSFSEVRLSIDFVIMFSVVFLITSSFFGSFILGLIAKGRELEGMKYLPLLILVSLLLFFGIRIGIGTLFGDFFGF